VDKLDSLARFRGRPGGAAKRSDCSELAGARARVGTVSGKAAKTPRRGVRSMSPV